MGSDEMTRAQYLSDLTGGELTVGEILAGMQEADAMAEAGVPPAQHRSAAKSKGTISQDIEDILGVELARAAAMGLVAVEDSKDRSPRSIDALAEQGRARERVRRAEEWRRDQRRRNAYSGFWGGPEDGQRRRKQVAAMTPAERKDALVNDLAAIREAAYRGFVNR